MNALKQKLLNLPIRNKLSLIVLCTAGLLIGLPPRAASQEARSRFCGERAVHCSHTGRATRIGTIPCQRLRPQLTSPGPAWQCIVAFVSAGRLAFRPRFVRMGKTGDDGTRDGAVEAHAAKESRHGHGRRFEA